MRSRLIVDKIFFAVELIKYRAFVFISRFLRIRRPLHISSDGSLRIDRLAIFCFGICCSCGWPTD
ncbi:MAG: hypothetical protein PUD45_04895 [Lactobacillus sp.]|nr:hypothetical protein [Lactobacillus sp.]